MQRAETTHEAGCRNPVWRSLRVLLAVAVTSLFTACGGSSEVTWSRDATNASAPPSPSNSAILAWDATISGISGYRVYYGTVPGTYLQVPGAGLPAGNATTYTITGLSSGTRYYFAVTAFDAIGRESPYSNEVFKDIP